MTPPRWASQDATLRDSETSLWSAYDTIPLSLQSPTKVATVSQFAAPRDGEASFFIVVFV